MQQKLSQLEQHCSSEPKLTAFAACVGREMPAGSSEVRVFMHNHIVADWSCGIADARVPSYSAGRECGQSTHQGTRSRIGTRFAVLCLEA